MKSPRHILTFWLPGIYFCWLSMMAVHELGHVLHAYASGGRVSRVSIPLLGFSLTTYSANPHPHVVAWGGVIWGSLIPIIAWIIARQRRWNAAPYFQFLAGFCLIANGIYLAVGWTIRAGDAADLRKFDTPVWVLIVLGAIQFAAGIYLWHRMGPFKTARPSSGPQ